MSDHKREILTDFSKHVPKLLKRQLITEHSQRYIQQSNIFSVDQSSKYFLPSIQRFHGSILFVDISGFTILSQKLDVESLKNYINGYFSQIIEIVEKWGGDVIKFAGDALYVVWQTNTGNRANGLGAGGEEEKGGGGLGRSKSMRSMSMMPTFINVEFRQNASDATNKAISCGLEICDVCSNFPVYVEGKNNPGRDGQGMFSSIVTSITSKIISRNMVSESQQPIAHLNVHCGVSVGLMAGLDVGYDNRWEYFIIGDPLAEVALAESVADKGDVVISRSAHEMYHPSLTGKEGRSSTCSCTALDEQCFRVSPMCSSSSAPPSPGDKRPKTTIAKVSRGSTELRVNDNKKLREELLSDLRCAVALITPSLKREYVSKVIQLCNKFHQQEGLSESNQVKEVKAAEKLLPVFIRSRVKSHLTQWLENYLIDHLACHVHDVARSGFVFFDTENSSTDTFHDILEDYLLTAHRTKSIPMEMAKKPNISVVKNYPSSPSSTAAVHVGDNIDADELDEYADPKFTYKDITGRMSTKQILNDRIEAEVRNVTVMFIKIDSFDMSLLIDDTIATDPGKTKKHFQRFEDVFGFLDRTENEQMADIMIVDRLQRCLEVLHRSIYSHGGRLRQFIVDDKGTVCIASFGLRGAVNDDNAANAMEAANAIVRGLQAMQLSSAIGITTGKVYCGLVGSYRRHEYAIMGPSVNLSARLMGKAVFGTILCDQETMDRDRSHDYRRVGEIMAKGYSQPVATYRPSFGDSISIPRSASVRSMPTPTAANISAVYLANNQTTSAIARPSQNMSSKTNQPVAKRFSALRFSLTLDSQHIASAIRSVKHLSGGPVLTREEKLNHLMISPFYFPDDTNAGNNVTNNNSNPMDHNSAASRKLNASIMLGDDVKSSTHKMVGFRMLRGREQESMKLVKFLFGSTLMQSGDSSLMFDYEAPSRMVMVSGSGGIGKTAFLSAFGQKLFSASKQDLGCNVMILSNRTARLSSSARLNPLRPIILEVLRWSKKIFESAVEDIRPPAESPHQSHRHAHRRAKHAVKRLIVKQDSIAEYAQALELIFTQLPHEMAPYKTVVMDILGIAKGDTDGDSSPSPSVTSSRSNANSESNLNDVKIALLAMMNFFATYTRKVILVMIEDIHAIDSATLEVLRHLLEHGRGVKFLVSSLVVNVNQTPTATQPQASAARQRNFKPPAASGSNVSLHISTSISSRSLRDRDSIANQFCSDLEDNPAFMKLELSPLSRDAAVALASDIAVNASPEMISKLIASGGGNPLYLVQLATTLAAATTATIDIAPQILFNEQSHLQTVKEMNHISAMHRRVEEIICFRLDRLDALSQLVLKAGTVAAAQGRTFSAKLIAFMINAKSNAFVNFVSVNSPLASSSSASGKSSGQNSPCIALSKSKSNLSSSLLMTATQNCASLNHNSHVNSWAYRHMVVRHVLKSLSDAGIFIVNVNDQLDAINGGNYSEILLSQQQQQEKEDEEYEFLIPTEQSIIYSLIVDEQREYFHGKVAQYSYQEWQTIKTATETATQLQTLSRCVLNVAYHAEQASFWELAMRAYGYGSGLERLLNNPKKAVETLLECYKIFKCFEQESGEMITPLSLSWMQQETFVLKYVLGKVPIVPGEALPLGLEEELECVYSVFDNDEANINLALKLHLFMSDLYFLSFADVDMAQHLLAVTLKILVVSRLCLSQTYSEPSSGKNEPGVDDSGSGKEGGGAMRGSGAMDTDDEILIDGDRLLLSKTLDDGDVCHFFASYVAILQASSPLASAGRTNVPSTSPLISKTVLQALEPMFLSHLAGNIPYRGIRILEATRAQNMHQLKELFSLSVAHSKDSKLDTVDSELEMNKMIVYFGPNLGMQANCVALQQVVFGSSLSENDADTEIVNYMYRQIDTQLQLHVSTITIFASLLHVLPVAMMQGRWPCLQRWLTLMDTAVSVSHDILSPQILLWRHLKTWIRASYVFHQSLQGGVVLPTEHVSLAEMKATIQYFMSADFKTTSTVYTTTAANDQHHDHHSNNHHPHQHNHQQSNSPQSTTSQYLTYMLSKCPTTIAQLLLRSGLHPTCLAWQLVCIAMYVHQKDIVVEVSIRQDYEQLFHGILSKMETLLSLNANETVSGQGYEAQVLVAFGLWCQQLSPLVHSTAGRNARVGHLIDDFVRSMPSPSGSYASRLQQALDERFHVYPASSSDHLDTPHSLARSYPMITRAIVQFFPPMEKQIHSNQVEATIHALPLQ